MKTEVVWIDQVPVKDPSIAGTVYCMAMRPDGQEVVVAVGVRLLIYSVATGELRTSMKGHTEAVYAVTYSKDGQQFASGGADKRVIIWTSRGEGILKYNHNDSIQCVAFNPVTNQVASGTEVDLGLWSADQKAVNKFKVPNKVTSVAWSPDGRTLAVGHYSGLISLRSNLGIEFAKIERTSPIWCMDFLPARQSQNPSTSSNAITYVADGTASPSHNNGSNGDMLVVGCWDQTLSFYSPQGDVLAKEQKLDYDPMTVKSYRTFKYTFASF